jgi:hypothetical protein
MNPLTSLTTAALAAPTTQGEAARLQTLLEHFLASAGKPLPVFNAPSGWERIERDQRSAALGRIDWGKVILSQDAFLGGSVREEVRRQRVVGDRTRVALNADHMLEILSGRVPVPAAWPQDFEVSFDGDLWMMPKPWPDHGFSREVVLTLRRRDGGKVWLDQLHMNAAQQSSVQYAAVYPL